MQIFKYLFDLRAVTIDKILALSFPAEPTITYENGGYSPKQVLNVDETFRNGRWQHPEHISWGWKPLLISKLQKITLLFSLVAMQVMSN